jgi:hypothetical protein
MRIGGLGGASLDLASNVTNIQYMHVIVQSWAHRSRMHSAGLQCLHLQWLAWAIANWNVNDKYVHAL